MDSGLRPQKSFFLADSVGYRIRFAIHGIIWDFDETDESLVLGLLHETSHLSDCINQFRKQINLVKRAFDLTIEIEGYTKADISGLSFEGMTALYGVLPLPENHIRQYTAKPLTHKEKDRNPHKLSYKIAKAVERDKSLIRHALEHIDRFLMEDRDMASKDLVEWSDILEMYSIQRQSRFLTSSSERANRLRQSNPFFAVLNADEKSQIAKDPEDNK